MAKKASRETDQLKDGVKDPGSWLLDLIETKSTSEFCNG